MPALLDRVSRFCLTLDTETLPHEATDLIRGMFCTGDWRLGVWVTVQDNVNLVGHLWVTPEPLMSDKCRYLLVRQAEASKGINIGDMTKTIWNEVEAWGKSMGIDHVIMVTHRPAKVFARRWGFVEKKVLMRKEIASG